MALRTLDGVAVAGRRVLVRADLNVPVRDGVITDMTRIERLCPTIAELDAAGARVVVCSHFDRPRGRAVPAMSLAPMANALAVVLGRPVAFAADCVGPIAAAAVDALAPGGVLVLENTRFHPGEETNDPEFVDQLAANADLYVNDAFSAAHRAHASTEGVAQRRPAYAGRLMQAEIEALEAALGDPVRPVCAIVGGSKISTKLALLGNLSRRVDVLVIGGAMANTFLAAQGHAVGRSLQEAEMHAMAREIMAEATLAGCTIVLPTDGVVAAEFRVNAPSYDVAVTAIPVDMMMLDVGPNTIQALRDLLPEMRTVLWNGPLGAFEVPPFDAATVAVAQEVAMLTEQGALRSVAGGGDTVAALRHAGVLDRLSYVSSAGGAFLEWLEGKTLPGVAALMA